MSDSVAPKAFPRSVQFKIAIVQGENFRCAAAKSDSNSWVHVLNGRPLFGVLEEVKVLCSCESHTDGRCPCVERPNVLAKSRPPITVAVAMEGKDQQELNRVRRKLNESAEHLHSIELKVEDL